MQNRITIIVLFITLVTIIAGWSFFNFGDQPAELIDEDRQKILSIQDEKLSKGDPNAPIKIVEYADILCPYCAKVNSDVIPNIESAYIDSKQVHYEVRFVAKISPDSERAARGAYCAAEQDKFWEYLDTAYKLTWERYYSQNKGPEDVPTFTQAGIKEFVDTLSLDTVTWDQCMASDKYLDTLSANAQEMNKLEAYGTPHFIINDKNYNGAPPFASFKAIIDAELRRQEAGA